MLPWVEQLFLAIALLMFVNPCACEAPPSRCETSAAHNDFSDDASIDGMHMSLLQESLRVASSKDLIATGSLASGSSASGSSASGSSASWSLASGSSSGLSSSKVHSDDGQDSSPKKQGKKSDASTGKEEAHSQRRRRKEENKEKKKSKGKEKTKDASKGFAIRVTLGNKKKSTYELSGAGLGCFLVLLGILFGLLFMCLCGPHCTAGSKCRMGSCVCGAGWCKSDFCCFRSREYEEHAPAKWGTQQVLTIATPPTIRSLSPGQLRDGYPDGTQGVDVGYARPGGGAQHLLGGSQSTRPFVDSF